MCIYKDQDGFENSEELVLLFSVESVKKFLVIYLCTGALTKGDRRAASGADLTEFNFDTPYGRNALRAMYQSVCTVSLQTSYTRTNLIMTLINCILYQDRRVLILLSTEVFYIYINLVHVVDIAHVIKFGISTQVMLNQILCLLASTPSLTLLQVNFDISNLLGLNKYFEISMGSRNRSLNSLPLFTNTVYFSCWK